MSFNFGTPKKKTTVKKSKKSKETTSIPDPTEEQVTEDHPGVLAMMEKARLRKENSSTKNKIQDLNEIHMYVCLVFQSEKQKFEFLSHFPDVLCVDEVFVDGESFAEAIDLQLTEDRLSPLDTKPNKKFVELVKISALNVDPISD